MIPKEIALQLVQLKDKVKTYSAVQRTLDVSARRDEVDEIKSAVEKINNAVADLAAKMDTILVVKIIKLTSLSNITANNY